MQLQRRVAKELIRQHRSRRRRGLVVEAAPGVAQCVGWKVPAGDGVVEFERRMMGDIVLDRPERRDDPDAPASRNAAAMPE